MTIAENLPAAQRKKLKGHEIDEELFQKSQIPITADYREVEGNNYLPAGFSVDEIKALGDFPDYAELSGVPLPEPYREFDIDKALPRPYRPFRWKYHQTMCKSRLAFLLRPLTILLGYPNRAFCVPFLFEIFLSSSNDLSASD